MAGPLEGVKILEIAEYIAIPSAMVICSDWGAEVIKVENTRGGDAYRGLTAMQGFSLKDTHIWFEQSNRNKKSIAVDLWQPEGQKIIHQLASKSDVVATNFTHPVVERFHIDYDTLAGINPQIIYTRLTGFGKSGPDKDKPGYDFAAFWANSGIMSKLGQPGAPPPPSQRVGFGDNLTSGFIAGAISAALFAREKTGKGQAIDLSLYNYGVWGLSVDMMPALNMGEEMKQIDRTDVTNPLWNAYRTNDNVWIQLVCPQSDRYWPQFCRALDMVHLENDPRFDSHERREQNNVELISIIDSKFAEKSYAELVESIADAGELIYGKVRDPLEVATDPQALENGFFIEMDHPSGQKITYIASPAEFSETPGAIKKTAPELGQHSEEILLDLGYSWDNLIELKDKGVIL